MSSVSGSKIREARMALKTRTGGRQGSQTWLAQQIGAHVTSVSDWERGANQPSPRHLLNIAAALGVPAEALMDEEDDEESDLSRDLLHALAPAVRLLVKATRA